MSTPQQPGPQGQQPASAQSQPVPPHGQQVPQQPVPPQGQQAPQPSAQQYPGAPYRAQQGPAGPVAPPAPSQSTILGNTNTFAFLAIIFAFISPIAGIVFGHMGLSQIRRKGEAGRGIGLTGLIISYASLAFLLLFFIFYISIIVMMFGAMGAAFSEIGSYDTYGYTEPF